MCPLLGCHSICNVSVNNILCCDTASFTANLLVVVVYMQCSIYLNGFLSEMHEHLDRMVLFQVVVCA